MQMASRAKDRRGTDSKGESAREALGLSAKREREADAKRPPSMESKRAARKHSPMRMNELSSVSERIVMSFHPADRCAVALGQALVVLGGILALACDDESARSAALSPAASERSTATSGTPDAGTR